ncbi:19367_t:CDS:10 [Racocetra persica]|uniref:19367_t:CDS:1 n=1 Tax=Racocetra persica TaxID=160502 RepID=A0ACA9M237_9GLOM|nr:19367_t:CDS:10 [Racocetra persica]
MAGIEKAFDKRTGKQKDKYGFEDLDPSDGGLAKWAASSIGSLALAAGSGGASILAAAAGEAAGNSLMDAAGAAIAKRRATPFGGIGDAKDELTMGFATQKAIEASMGGIMSGAGGIISATKKAGMEFAGEFIAHKSFLPLLFVEARTSAVYSDRWRNEMNRRLIQYDFYFGKDPEVSLAKDVGMEFGIEDIFVYQLRESKRPKITLESLFPGFRGTLTNSIGQDGGTDTLNIQNKQTKITKEKHTCSSGGGVSSSGGFNVESCGLKTGYGDKVNQYLGGDTPTKKSWSDFPSHLKENQYQKVNFPKSNGLVKFGRGQKYVVMGYMKEYKGGSTHPVELYCEVNNTRIIYSNNPPDAFSGGGGAQISLPVGLGNIGQATGGLGMSLPNVSSLDISTQMPEQIQSQLNTNEININLQQQEMPKMQEMKRGETGSHKKDETKEKKRDNLTNLDLSKCLNLERINVSLNEFISVEFLSKLPYPSKMTKIEIYGRRNKFYGSLESLKDLNELERICIEATDVDRGLEYLTSLAKIQKKTQKYCVIECSPHSSDAKCKTIQDQLRPYNYDLEAWQLDHPELMKKVTKISDSERVQVVTTKIEEIKKELEQVKHNEPNKDKKIERLESKLKLLEEELGFLTKENRELRTTIRELEIKINSLTQKLEQINLISQIEISPK